MKNKNILVLTTRKNFVWTSMQEIIPQIETSWINYCREYEHSCSVVNVDEIQLKDLVSHLLTVDYLVVTAFNLEIVKALRFIRAKVGVDSPMFIYIHGLASVACWPFSHWGLVEVLNENDLFISSADRDSELLELTCNKSSIKVVPFTIEESEIRDLAKTQIDSTARASFYYIGRLSDQKNLLNLIWAFYLLKKYHNLNFHFDIFGNEDQLGSPNMGLDSTNYLDKIKQLINDLSLDSNITLHGFVNRHDIYELLPSGRNIFISPSLHSDENFGMAALRSLMKGDEAILTNWGGHSDFQKTFLNRVSYIDVNMTENGPVTYVHNIIASIQNCLTKLELDAVDTSYYLSKSISKRINDITNTSNSKLVIKSLTEKLAQSWRDFGKNKSKCFSSYDDPNFLSLAALYANKGQIEKWSTIDFSKCTYEISPLVEIVDDNYLVNDYKFSNMITLKRCNDSLVWLYKNGYLYITD